MLAVVAALGAADALVVSAPHAIAPGSSAYIAGDSTGATVVWYDGKSCVKAARLDRDAKAGATADLGCSPATRPAMIASCAGHTVVAWTDKLAVMGGFVDASLHVTTPFMVSAAE